MPDQPSFNADFQELLQQLFVWRRDVRRFQTTPVSREVIDEVLRTANLSPSVGNSQPWRWVEVISPERRKFVQDNFEAANRAAAEGYRDDNTRAHYLSLKLAGLRESPVQFAVFCDPGTTQGRGLGIQTMPEMLSYSTVTCIHTFWLAARARGLGVGWVSILDSEDVRRGLDVPGTWKLVAYLCVGWPVEEHTDPELERAHWQSREPLKLYQR